MTTMTKSSSVHTRIEPDVKAKAEGILKQLGLSASDAVSMLYNQIIHHNGLPFSVNIPNAETISAMKDVRAGKTVQVTLAELGERYNISSDETDTRD